MRFINVRSPPNLSPKKTSHGGFFILNWWNHHFKNQRGRNLGTPSPTWFSIFVLLHFFIRDCEITLKSQTLQELFFITCLECAGCSSSSFFNYSKTESTKLEWVWSIGSSSEYLPLTSTRDLVSVPGSRRASRCVVASQVFCTEQKGHSICFTRIWCWGRHVGRFEFEPFLLIAGDHEPSLKMLCLLKIKNLSKRKMCSHSGLLDLSKWSHNEMVWKLDLIYCKWDDRVVFMKFGYISFLRHEINQS